MNLRGIVAVSGKPGLFKALAQNKTGFVLESLDNLRNKLVTGPNAKLAALEEITVYGEDDDFKLKDILAKMQELQATNAIPTAKATNDELKKYFALVAPGHDAERVYVSDIKKIVNWYSILSALPLFEEADPAEETTAQAE